MKAASKKNTNLVIGAMIAVAVLATFFWVVLLSPKREEAAKLEAQARSLESSLAQHQSEVAAAEAARKSFASDYAHLVVLGKAVPGDSETASLLVQINRIAARSHVAFDSLSLSSTSGAETETSAPSPVGGAVSPTEAAASLLPLGAAIGPAGLAVMPYELTFEGTFFKIAKFLEGLDSLVKTTNANVAVDGRLITVDSFSLEPGGDGYPTLLASFTVTTYLTPPGQGLTGGASPTGPSTEAGATLASATTETAP
jgi:Tfp pilus assembly protein PilO